MYFMTSTSCICSLSFNSISSLRFNFNNFSHITKSQARFLANPSDPERFRSAFYNRYHFEAQSDSASVVSSVLSSISSCSSIPVCQLIHSRVLKILNYNDGFIGDRLASLYAKMGCSKDAHNLFDEIPNKDLVSWNSFISVFSRHGDLGSSFNAFYRMRLEDGMNPNEVTLISIISASGTEEGGYIHGFAVKTSLLSELKVVNSLMNMYGRLGYLNAACCLFSTIQYPNLVSWNSIIKVHVLGGMLETVVSYFNLMRGDGIYPDQATVVTILQGFADVGVGKIVDAFHGNILRSGLDKSTPILTALVSVYAKFGRLTASRMLFSEIKEPDVIAWTAMLAGYAVHGCGKQAIEHFELMVKKRQEPDHVTFTHLLNACSHSGLIEEGKRLFEAMLIVYGVKPRLDHYSCLVDLLGRSGRLNDARALIDSMPMEPNSAVWGALLNACRVHGDIELGEKVAKRLIELNPSDPRNYIMLSSMYSKAGRGTDVSKVRALMRDQGLVRTAGCSFIEHGNKIHRFAVGDQVHPDSESIYAKLAEVIEKIRQVGYVPNTGCVVHDVEEDVKDEMLSRHSEKLAIAFGLLVYDAGVTLVITKNLRICGDCHNMAKLVSLVERRVIVVRDTKRFHHFSEGVCSCGDYW